MMYTGVMELTRYFAGIPPNAVNYVENFEARHKGELKNIENIH